MKIKFEIILYTVLLLLLPSKIFAQLPAGVYSIRGLWETTFDNALSYEWWEITPDSNLTGFDYFINSKGDTAIFEKLEIIKKDSDIFYVATVIDQNDNKPVYFKMTEWTSNVFVFENKEHDFPQKIMYYLKGSDRFDAIIEGPDKDKIKSFEFKFTRKK